MFSLIIYSWAERKRQHAPAVQWDDSDLVFVERAIETGRARKRAWRRNTEGGTNGGEVEMIGGGERLKTEIIKSLLA